MSKLSQNINVFDIENQRGHCKQEGHSHISLMIEPNAQITMLVSVLINVSEKIQSRSASSGRRIKNDAEKIYK